MYYTLLSFLFTCACLFLAADEDPTHTQVKSEVHDNAVPSLVNLTSLPSSFVNRSVNIITGDYCENNQDDIVSGPDRYILGHNYCSSSLEEGNLGDGWNFSHHYLLEVFQPSRIDYVRKNAFDNSPFLYPIEMTDGYKAAIGEETLFGNQTLYDLSGSSESSHGLSHPSNSSSTHSIFTHPLQFLHNLFVEKGLKKDEEYSDPIFLSLFEPSGGRLLFKTDYDEDHKERSLRHFQLVTKKSGFTNLNHGQISGQTNVKNIDIKWTKKKDVFTVTFGDGTTRLYQRQSKQHQGHHSGFYRDYQLYKESKPNGNYTSYRYNDKSEITQINSFNKTNELLSWIKFEQKSPKKFAKDHSLHVKTSDGRHHIYYFKRLAGSHLHGTYSVSKIQRQGLPKIAFTYSKKKKHQKPRVTKKSCDDGSWLTTKYYTKGTFVKNRVRMQLAPVGPNGTEVVTHRYNYYKGKKGAGHCSVRDAYNNITRYYRNKDKRLVKVAKFDSNNKILMSEEYIWAENKSYNEGRLRAHIVKDEHGKTRYVHKYNYDGRGNVLEDILLARITKNAGDIKFKSDLTHSETCDKVVTRYAYSNDGLNLKESECDPLGNYTYYEYHSNTNLLKAKFICDKTTIIKREFFTYDESAILTEHIVDDGNTKDQENYEGITERHMTWITPRKTAPHYGEPQEINEFYFDLSTKERIWLKRTTNHYNDKGLVAKQELMNQAGQTVCYDYRYDDIGRLNYSKDPLGNSEELIYDTNTARLIEKKGARDDVRWQYHYDLCGRVIKQTEKHSSGLELTTEFTYDLLGRKTAVKDFQDNTTYYEYDALNRITKITYPELYDHQGNKIAPTKTYSYRALGSQVTETDELGQATKTTYNALGKVTDQEFADGTSCHYEYDIKGNVIKELAPNKTENHLFYDAFDRLSLSKQLCDNELLEQQEIVYNTFHTLQELGPSHETVNYGYDEAGRQTSMEQEGRKTLFFYDQNNRLGKTKSILEDGFIATRYSYDELDRLVHETLYDHTCSLRTYKIYGYDAEGNQSSLMQNIDGQNAISQAIYHPHGLLQESTDAEGNKTFHHYYHSHINEHGQTTLRKETIDARGVTLEEIYDTRGNLAQILQYDPMHTLIAKKELFYDAANNCIRTQEYATATKTIITTFEYTNNHLTAITEAKETPEEKTTRYLYNNYGQLETILHADGTILNHRYDKKGRLAHFYSNDYTTDYTYNYDSSDRIVEAVNNATGNKTSRSYNSFGEMTSETLETGITLTYSYDMAGRVKELLLPDQSKITYSQSAFLDSITRQSATGQTCYSHKTIDRDLSGFVKVTTLPAQAGTLTICRDKIGRTTTINHHQFTQNVQGFDAVGNLLTLETKDPTGLHTRSFSYDFLSQLTEESGSATHSYSYDALYNRLTKNNTSYTVNSLHSTLSDANRTFSYDKRGNRLRLTSDNDDVDYSYDALDRLIEVRTNGECYTYSYDAFNRRLTRTTTQTTGAYWWKKEATSKEYYIYALDNEIGAMSEDMVITQLRILGEGLGAEIGAAVALELDGTTYIPIHDRQGNVALILDSKGNTVEHYSFDAFGNETTSQTPINPWRFSSKRCDPETGLIYFGRRYYDPTLGKWLTQDPLGFKEGPNLYAYLQNGPMTRFDAYGLYVEHELDRPVDSNNRASPLVSYNASYGFCKREAYHKDFYDIDDSPPPTTNADYSNHPIYSSFWDDKIYTPIGFTEADNSRSVWHTVADYSLSGLEGICLAMDAHSALMLAGGAYSFNPYIAGVGVIEKGLVIGGKSLIKRLRNRLIKTSSKELTSKTVQAVKAPFQTLTKLEVRNLPKNPNDLLKRGYTEITHPRQGNTGHRTFQNPVTKNTIRFDSGKAGKSGHGAHDHYHYHNPNASGRMNEYLDMNGTPCPRHSYESHIYPKE